MPLKGCVYATAIRRSQESSWGHVLRAKVTLNKDVENLWSSLSIWSKICVFCVCTVYWDGWDHYLGNKHPQTQVCENNLLKIIIYIQLKGPNENSVFTLAVQYKTNRLKNIKCCHSLIYQNVNIWTDMLIISCQYPSRWIMSHA